MNKVYYKKVYSEIYRSVFLSKHPYMYMCVSMCKYVCVCVCASADIRYEMNKLGKENTSKVIVPNLGVQQQKNG